jgi:hypothetical protein
MSRSRSPETGSNAHTQAPAPLRWLLLGFALSSFLGLWLGQDLSRGSRSSFIPVYASHDRYTFLRPYLSESSQVDFLMDLDRSSGAEQGMAKHQRYKGQRSIAQYVLAPVLLQRVPTLRTAMRRARAAEPPYSLIWSEQFDSSLLRVERRLRKVAQERGLVMEVQRVDSGLALLTLGKG